MDTFKDNEAGRVTPAVAVPPDVMNDPAYDTNATSKQNGADEPDTCRICRGEGSQEEPLFFPCKCSGSIKFVHQNCLMEWLSHSQKKHCELCKTPFRFTKLYHPHMPNAVPLPIFLRQAALHTWKSVITWSRFQLVMLVWIVWLPWCMRTIWRGLFWMGDGKWVDWTVRRLENEAALSTAAELAAGALNPINKTPLISREAIATSFLSQISGRWQPFFAPFRLIFQGGPPGLKLGERLYGYAMHGSSNTTSASTAAVNSTARSALSSRSSWLSDVQFLNTLTRSTVLNNLVIDMLEGQLITVLTVTAFILVFLIREWVVQQQPNLNNGADLDAMVAAGQNAVAPAQGPGLEQRPEGPGRDDNIENMNGGAEIQVPGARMIARAGPRRDRPHPLRQISTPEINQGDEAAEGLGLEPASSLNFSEPGSDSSHQSPEAHVTLPSPRPPMPDRQKLSRAAEMRRILEETSQASGSGALKDTFQDFWSRGDGRPAVVIDMIEQEGRRDELAWIIAIMTRFQAMGPATGNKIFATTIGDSAPTLASNDGHDDGNNCQSNSDGDEGFVILEKPSLHSSPEAELECSARDGEPSNYKTDHLSMDSQQSSSILKAVSDLGSDDLAHPPPKVYDQWDFSTIDREQTDESSYPVSNDEAPPDSSSNFNEDNAPLAPNSSSENPFHPDYHGDLPQRSGISNVPTLEIETADVSEPINPQSTSVEESDNQPRAFRAPGRAQRLMEYVTNWLWGGLPTPMGEEQPAGDEERIVHDIANEAPFVPVDHGRPMRPAANNAGDNARQDPEVIAAARQAGIDPNEAEGIEDIEDLEGILELIGMQGPIAGLIQNGMFCAVLVSLTMLSGLWIPYISGKLFLVLLTHPVTFLMKMPLRWAASTADMVIDLFTFLTACSFYGVDTVISFMCVPIGWLISPLGRIGHHKVVAETAKSYAKPAFSRLAEASIAAGDILANSDIPTLSIVAHESLRWLEDTASSSLHAVGDFFVTTFVFLYDCPSLADLSSSLSSGVVDRSQALGTLISNITQSSISIAPSIMQIDLLRVNLHMPQRTTVLDYDLAYWGAKDRAIAVIFGYLFFGVLGIIYLYLSAWIRGTNKAGKVEGAVADALYQAGGVLKVVLIIGIEMIAFPLYCGFLLDIALLPLFGNATLMSRLDFTISSPYTSIFVHWFVGTCYMFHFALFVSMCRKILRNGVLFFIRDPDDPTFHPVRDVLERNVSTQLWKITFSALVYGGLVIVCLGGVVSGINYAFDGLLPIHWSSNEPVLEFPVDLLFYNFLMPLAVKFFRPSEGLTKIYTWWFRKCARILRLTNFLFSEEKKDEEGRDLRHGWIDILSITPHESNPEVSTQPEADSTTSVLRLEKDEHFVFDGRYVRAPASDQVRIPKGARTFLEVDKSNHRVDGEIDSEQGLHGHKNDMFIKVYIPPFFRVRIGILAFLVWLFAATTGVGMTVGPLVLGRFIFANLAPAHLHMNDIYAYSIGVYAIGGAAFVSFHRHNITAYFMGTLTPHTTTIASFLYKTGSSALRLASLTYTYAAFGILLPALLSLLMEFYLIVPLHTYFSSTFTALNNIPSERHIIHLIQDWTLGILYLKMAARVILYNTPSRPAAALRGIIRNGWLRPDAWLATRGFILPATTFMGFALTAPLALGWILNCTLFNSYSVNDEVFRACVYRYSYPGVLALGFAMAFFVVIAKAFAGWRKRVRDEVYLIGERLHNFGESKRRKRSSKGKGRAVAVAADA